VTIILLLFAALCIAPLAVGLALTRERPSQRVYPSLAGSVLLCALAFNLIFFWQELWLVIPKALTPGLHPVLFHNNHEWSGYAADVELLQGSGAVATFALGLIFAAILATGARLGPTTRSFCFWLAFEGLSQAFTQLAIGLVMPGNDVGRALASLGVERPGHLLLGAALVAALTICGVMLAALFPGDSSGRVRASDASWTILMSAILSILLIIPFRVPRDPVETTLIPLIVNGIGAGWTILGFALAPSVAVGSSPVRPRLAVPAISLLALLLVFQLILRPGIPF